MPGIPDRPGRPALSKSPDPNVSSWCPSVHWSFLSASWLRIPTCLYWIRAGPSLSVPYCDGLDNSPQRSPYHPVTAIFFFNTGRQACSWCQQHASH